MKKNGFTLVEITVCVVLLVTIFLIVVPKVNTMINNKKKNAYNSLISTVKDAAQAYVYLNVNIVDDAIESQGYYEVSIRTLQENELLENKLENPLTGKNIPSTSIVKIIKNNEEYIYKFSLDYQYLLEHIIDLYSSESSINYGWGVNQWGESTYADGTPYEGADLMQYLNKMNYGGTSITCYGGSKNSTTTCPTNTIDETSKSLIDYHTWNTGGAGGVEGTAKTDTLAFYNTERGNQTGKISNGGRYCNDTVNRTTTWTGYVGLPYITDYAYASSENICETNMVKQDSSNAYICKNNNWMFKIIWYWTLSPFAHSGSSRDVLGVGSDGYVYNFYAADGGAVFPAIYLKSNILIESGKGTSSDPYILKAGS